MVKGCAWPYCGFTYWKGIIPQEIQEHALTHMQPNAVAVATFIEHTVKPLTPAQTRVLQLSAEGYNCADIGLMLGIVTETVKHHRLQLMRRLNAENIANAVYIGLKTAIIV